MRVSISDIGRMKAKGERIVMVTAYDYTAGQIIDRTDIPLVLVGDSLGMVVQGHDSTLPVTLDEIIYHVKAVMRGARRPLIIGDLPFLTYSTPEQALQNAGRLMQQTGCQAVKLEGGVTMAPTVRRLVETGIPVMGHLGFTPQSVNQIGMRVQGKSAAHARQLIEDALALEAAGAFAVVLELIPAPLAREITARLRIPTIGIGAGVDCAGEVQVWHDILGLYTDRQPRHTRRYLSLADEIGAALSEYAADVRNHTFPAAENSSTIDAAVLQEALEGLEPAIEHEEATVSR
jgi:3-methyl-2-oxobutanoate hydroxymethyltransferase